MLLLVVLSVPARVRAADIVPVLMIAPRTDIEMSRRTWEAVRGQLSDLPVSLVIEWVDTLEPDLRSQIQQARRAAERTMAITVFWADLSVPDQVYLYLSQPTGERILVRSVATEGGGDEGRLETLAIIVRTSVRAVLEGGQIGIQKPVPEEENATSGTNGKLEIGLSYSLSPFAAGNEWLHGPGIQLSAILKNSVLFIIAYRILLPVYLEKQGVSLQLSSHPFVLGSAYRWRLKAWSFDLGATFFADLVTAKVRQRDYQITPKQPQDQWMFGFSPLVRVGWSPSQFATLFGGVAIDIVFNQPEYIVSMRTSEETVVAPWTARPVIQLGAAFAML